jgi:2-polyprenyl-3-methyl-5-hydroxy-6-metoxy-1,4-benzoquinol methylase
MPTSDHHNITAILTVISGLQPRSVLDVGCGYGKYGSLLREYLDIWHERLEPSQWNVSLSGIEAFPRYRNPIHDFVYDQVYYGEAQQILPKLGRFDVILIADVIEHLPQLSWSKNVLCTAPW